ncbi:MAG: phosphoribosylformylglycinamidine synthase I [Candidatus Omnitrophica bacterium]|jgi:phosphoribosylformylglycinamidine synthase|nr:phosphoribosylformylglycinamidine synthase I [Candidatus Omnitrophota bacterium]
MKPKVLILRTAGTNCDKETEFAFSLAGAQTYLYHVNHVKEKNDLKNYQIIAMPGGFSYGDDLGAGKILSLELSLWFKDRLKEFISRGGLIIGICNGFQVLVKTGILPDLDFKQKVTLTDNDSAKFEDRWVYLKRTENREQGTEREKKIQNPENIWLKDLPEIINLPVAHGEGKFYAEKDILDKIEHNDQVVLRYADSSGKSASYPFNPNGSLNDIAGITDATGKVLGLMPHPERFMFKHQWPYWKENVLEPYGLQIFKNGVSYFK